MESLAAYIHSFPERDKKVLTGIVLTVVILIASLPHMTHELLYGHDIFFHLTRIQSIANGLADGQFPVRLYDGFVYGYGYPSGVCYPDIILYGPALLVLAGLKLKWAYSLFMIFENIFCALCAYFCFKKIFASRTVGLACSILWTLAAYRLVDNILRANVGEAWALNFLPFIAFGVWKICQNNATGGGALPALGGLPWAWAWLALCSRTCLALCLLEWRAFR